MSDTDRSRATQLVKHLHDESTNASADLFPLVYDRLRHLARALFRSQRRDHTLQPTALVHEAYLKMVNHDVLDPDDEVRFARVAARAMRQVLIDHARAANADKRGGGVWQRLTLSAVSGEGPETVDLIALDEALERLADLDARQAAVVELRFFGGLSVPEAATALGVSSRTVDVDWRMAKAWLNRALGTSA